MVHGMDLRKSMTALHGGLGHATTKGVSHACTCGKACPEWNGNVQRLAVLSVFTIWQLRGRRLLSDCM